VDHFFKLPFGLLDHFVTTPRNSGDGRGNPHIWDKANPLGGTAVRIENAVASESHLKIARKNNLRSVAVGAGCVAADEQNSWRASKRHCRQFDVALREFVYQNNDL
jgi:hypothetical protein